MTASPVSAHQGPPLFLLSFRQRDELASVVSRAGWRVVAARRAEGAERRWLASGAAVAVVDARGALSEGLAATAVLAGPIAASGAALLVLVSQTDIGQLGAFLDAGATHFLTSPMREPEIVQALRFAARHAERVAGDWRPAGEQGRAEPMGWRYDSVTRIVHLTPGLAALTGLSEMPTLRQALARIDVGDRGALRTAIRRLETGTAATAFAHDLTGLGRVVEHLQRDPHTRRIHALVEPLGNVPDAGAVVRDALTGVRDAASARRWLDRRLEAEQAEVGLAMIGLSRFEVVNATYGRAAGDRLLRAVSRRIEEAARDVLGRAAMVARIGGSEFLIAAQVDADRMAMAAARVEAALSRAFVTEEGLAPIGARVAVTRSVAGDDAAALLRRASEMLADSRDGRSPSTIEDSGASLDRLAIELRGALDADEIETLFQPQVTTGSGQIVGVEALARWRHPELGELGAELLFAAGARAGLDIALSDHVQQVALETAARWPASLKGLRLSINITAGDVARPGFADVLLDRVDASGFPRGRLTFEITESGLIDDLGAAARLFADLRMAGCRVAIDDFGTGYSSLAYLKALPLDYLKIDKQLSQDITGSARDRVVVRGVIDMARSLGLSVIAEGVETEAQLDLLAKEGCQLYQGFLCAEPLSVAALVALVAK